MESQNGCTHTYSRFSPGKVISGGKFYYISIFFGGKIYYEKIYRHFSWGKTTEGEGAGVRGSYSLTVTLMLMRRSTVTLMLTRRCFTATACVVSATRDH